MKKWLTTLSVLAVIAALVGVGAYGIFTDQETSESNSLTAGTLDLKVNDEDDPITLKYSISDIAPGYDSGYQVWCLKNTGSVPGQPHVEFSTIINNENGTNEPEDAAEAETYARAAGELGQYLKYTIGMAPCGWSVPSKLISEWQTGPQHPWGIPGLDGLSGNTYFNGPTGYQFPVLSNGESVGFFMKVKLDEDLRMWDGTKWLDMDDNLIQSDSVEFDITFHLEQAP